jgi:hypothetical protein
MTVANCGKADAPMTVGPVIAGFSFTVTTSTI